MTPEQLKTIGAYWDDIEGLNASAKLNGQQMATIAEACFQYAANPKTDPIAAKFARENAEGLVEILMEGIAEIQRHYATDHPDVLAGKPHHHDPLNREQRRKGGK